ncbi:cytochrome C551 [Chryseobacterium arthrosphaerae]|uniref:Cytochrome C551 n=1 Tax=Chryseobacterium arthrosphaerae TaxID=651561 RepID=A0A1B8ZSW1_9FLAO|nr:cytochrome C551 [Chryseobacterium arthrosphaerae]AYZ13107.1 cytochrome C551 [Chryseobacterium arthrosphaerae]OCA74672.1 cytochrome C551 [Chryseobacterium arthrosphaerae]QUY53911.1 cytochrome C551 [Chryseobacterium arthrosphaerae]UEQ78385.1 cytochrome C551 [Chryseobacterium arthrosphaerae]
MKKLLLTAIGIGLFAVSCGTKESTMSSSSRDSTVTDSVQRNTPPATTDTMTTKMTNPDTIKIKKDSMVTTPVK